MRVDVLAWAVGGTLAAAGEVLDTPIVRDLSISGLCAWLLMRTIPSLQATFADSLAALVKQQARYNDRLLKMLGEKLDLETTTEPGDGQKGHDDGTA